MRLGRVGWEYHQGGLGHEWKSAPNHWLPTKGEVPEVSRREIGAQALGLGYELRKVGADLGRAWHVQGW